MPLNITAIKYSNEYGSVQTPNLRGGIGDLITIEHDFELFWSTLNVTLVFKSATKSIQRQDCAQYNGSFINDGFSQGDSIVINGSALNNGVYTIHAINDGVIVVDQTIHDEVSSPSSCNVYGITQPDVFDFGYNFLDKSLSSGNPSNTFAFINDNGASQKFSLPFSELISNYYYESYYPEHSYSAYMLPLSGSHAWLVNQLGTVNCKPLLQYTGTTTDYKQQYKLTFTTLIAPLFAPTQLKLLQNALSQSLGGVENTTPPNYIQNGLVYVFQLLVRANINSQMTFQASSTSNSGNNNGMASVTNKSAAVIPVKQTLQNSAPNIVWFNGYYVGGVKSSTGAYISKAQFALKQLGSYTANSITANQINAGFSNAFSFAFNNPSQVIVKKAVLNFVYLPVNAGDFTGYSDAANITLDRLMFIDRVTMTANNTAASGINYGDTNYQVFSNDVKFIQSDDLLTVTVQGTISFGTLVQNQFKNLQDNNYLIWVSFETDTTGIMDNQTHSPVICDVNKALFYSQIANPLTFTSGFYRKPDKSDSPTAYFNGHVGDYGVFQSVFTVLFNPIQAIKAINVYVENYIYTGSFDGANYLEKIVLDSFQLDTSKFFDGKKNNIQFTKSNNFNLAASDYRNIISVSFVPYSTTGYTFTLNYGFQFGYQYWRPNQQKSLYNGYSSKYYAGYTQKAMGGNGTVLQQYAANSQIFLRFEVVANQGETDNFFENYAYMYCYDEVSNVAGYTYANSVLSMQGVNLNNAPPISGKFILQTIFTSTSAVSYTNIHPIMKAKYSLNGVDVLDSNDILNGISQTSIFTAAPTVNISSDGKSIIVRSVCSFDNIPGTVNFDKFQFITTINNLS